MELWKHQKEYGDKLLNNELSALFFEPRTGKTLTAIHGSRDGDRLIVCPNSVKGTWLRDLSLYGETDIYIWDKKKPKSRPKNVIVNYESLRKSDLLSCGYDTIIFDESHRLSNIRTKLFDYCYSRLRELCSSRVILLSGTPCVESWTQLVAQSVIATGSFYGYIDPWEALRTLWTYDDSKYKWLNNDGTVEICRSVMTSIGATMTQKEAGIDTKKLYRVIPVTLSKEEENDWLTYNLAYAPQAAQYGLMLQSFASGRNENGVIHKSSKLDAVVEYVVDLRKPCVILCQFTASIEYLEASFKLRGIDVSTIHGKDAGAAYRDRVVASFGESVRIIIAQVDTVKVGLNFSASDTLIFAENSWSGEARIQAEERCTVKGKEAVEIIDFVADSYLDGLADIDMCIRKAVIEKRDFNVKNLTFGKKV